MNTWIPRLLSCFNCTIVFHQLDGAETCFYYLIFFYRPCSKTQASQGSPKKRVTKKAAVSSGAFPRPLPIQDGCATNGVHPSETRASIDSALTSDHDENDDEMPVKFKDASVEWLHLKLKACDADTFSDARFKLMIPAGKRKMPKDLALQLFEHATGCRPNSNVEDYGTTNDEVDHAFLSLYVEKGRRSQRLRVPIDFKKDGIFMFLDNTKKILHAISSEDKKISSKAIREMRGNTAIAYIDSNFSEVEATLTIDGTPFSLNISTMNFTLNIGASSSSGTSAPSTATKPSTTPDAKRKAPDGDDVAKAIMPPPKVGRHIVSDNTTAVPRPNVKRTT